MKVVCRNGTQLANAYDKMVDALRNLQQKFDGAIMVEWKEHKPPRTMKQSRKIHAMMNDLGNFTGDSNMKGWIKGMDFWPTVYIEHFGDAKIVAKSEAVLTKEEESIIIERLYQIGTMLPGFEWSHE